MPLSLHQQQSIQCALLVTVVILFLAWLSPSYGATPAAPRASGGDRAVADLAKLCDRVSTSGIDPTTRTRYMERIIGAVGVLEKLHPSADSGPAKQTIERCKQLKHRFYR